MSFLRQEREAKDFRQEGGAIYRLCYHGNVSSCLVVRTSFPNASREIESLSVSSHSAFYTQSGSSHPQRCVSHRSSRSDSAPTAGSSVCRSRLTSHLVCILTVLNFTANDFCRPHRRRDSRGHPRCKSPPRTDTDRGLRHQHHAWALHDALSYNGQCEEQGHNHWGQYLLVPAARCCDVRGALPICGNSACTFCDRQWATQRHEHHAALQQVPT